MITDARTNLQASEDNSALASWSIKPKASYGFSYVRATKMLHSYADDPESIADSRMLT